MRRFIGAIIFSLVCFQSASAADLVVIASTGAPEAMKPGTILASSATITLPKGAKLTLISQAGEISHIAGPYKGKPPKAGEDKDSASSTAVALNTIADAVTGRKAQSDAVGAVRKVAVGRETARVGGIWPLNVDSSGPRCLLAAGNHLWRRDPSRQTEVSLRGSGGRALGIIWKSGDRRLAIPDNILGDGERLAVSVGKSVRRFDVYVLPDDIGTRRHGRVLNWLISVGCRRQAHELIDILHGGLAK